MSYATADNRNDIVKHFKGSLEPMAKDAGQASFRGLFYEWNNVGSCRITNKITGMGVTKATFDLNYLVHGGKRVNFESMVKALISHSV